MWDQDLQRWSQTIEDFAVNHFDLYRSEDFQSPKILVDSITYSLSSGGKRFRPLLAMIVAEHYQMDPLQMLPWACSVEMIHTYSLIHDDLPCMDNDDFRRGKPTNHKVYGEAMALLAGDGLLTEAFGVLTKHYNSEPKIALQLVDRLCSAAGVQGMIGGQVEDMQADHTPASYEGLLRMHKLKTAQLIRVALEGAALVCSANQNDTLAFKFYGENLGLAFQIRDDILDADNKTEDKKNFVHLIGMEKTQALLEETSRKAKNYLNKLMQPNVRLLNIVDYNLSRDK
jgi:geranylgeranyl diphosphate synthase type II